MANTLRQRLGSLLSRPISSPPSVAQTAQAGTKRFFSSKSSHAHDDAEESVKWRSITGAAYIACFCMGFYTLSSEEQHAGERPAYSYLHIRNKPFPWGSDGLFEYKHGGHEEH